MIKIKYLIIFFQIIFFTSILNAQYILKPAFPNLPGFSSPVEIVNAADGSNRLFVVEQKGKIYTFNDDTAVSTKKLFIDLTSIVTQVGGDRGLLGLAFHPDYENNRYFYVYYIADSSGTPYGQWSRVARYTASATNPDTALNSSQVRLLNVAQPDYRHKGGKMEFGTDGYLYISLGDGGRENDPDNYAQSKNVLLGKILRINVDSSSGGKNYSIPPSNPFFGNPFGYREEIFAYGLRNMWKFSIDPLTGRIFGADVGQYAFEEINLIENGKNYGWNKMEGFHCFPDTNNCDTTGRGFTRPLLELRRDVAVSAIGGYVYRGNIFPELYGKYIFSDWYYGKVWAMDYNPSGPSSYVQLLDSNIFLPSLGKNELNELYFCGFGSSNIPLYKMYNPNTITLNLKVILEGHYNDITNTLKVRDSVDVFLYSVSFPNDVLDSARTVLDSLNFSGLCFFRNAPSGVYYIVVKFKTGLETWSKANGESFQTGESYSYDFTNEITNAYGNNLKLKGSQLCIISGDCNNSGVINASDRALVVGQLGSSGQLAGDLDGNGVVNAIDRAIVVSNLGRNTIKP
ncbi:MAG: PQQ-dependent sugar dehydrogenase [Ignavibacteria bacterium]